MTVFPARALWPALDRTPYLRLAVALFAAPGVIATLLSLFAFLIAGMTEATSEAVLRTTAASAAALSGLVYAFTMTFGVLGVALLWRAARRGAVAWAFTGAAAGALAGLLFGALAMPAISQAVVTGFALAGWSIFVLIRRFAGVRDTPVPAPA